MGLYQSFSQVFVTNSPALLAEGKTVDALAVGQIGFLDGKTMTGVTAPTYAKNKALYAVWGTPDIFAGDFSGVPNENEYSKLIKGKLIRKVRVKKAVKPQTPLWTVGWSGDVSDTDTLSANPGESKELFIKLSGTIIDRLYSKQGLVKIFKTTPKPVNACDDDCAAVLCSDAANELVEQINSDKDFKKFIRAKAIIECDPAASVTTASCYEFLLTVCDTGDAKALGMVQAQYPDDKVEFVSRAGALTTYGIIKDADVTPDAFSSLSVYVPECPECPSGYTLTEEAKVFQVRTAVGVNSAAVQGAFTDEVSVTLVNSDPQFLTYYVAFPNDGSVADADVLTEAAAAGYVATLVGVQSNICTQDAATETDWVDGRTLTKQAKTYRLTIGDTVCGSDRLDDLQAAYPELEVSLVDASGSCVHTYETSVYSNCFESGCAVEEIKWVKPVGFEGAEWKEVVADVAEGTTCQCGIQIESAFFNINTNECTFDAFPYENDVVHVQVSQYNPDFNSNPDDEAWVVKQIRQVQYPQGHGAQVQHLEKESKQHDARTRSTNPVVREVQGYSLQADPTKYYDLYTLEYETRFKSSGGWAEEYSQTIHLNLYVQEGQGSAIATALNSYITSAGIEEDGIA